MKTKLKSHDGEVTDFHDKKIPKTWKVNSNRTCLSVISLDSALKKDGSHYRRIHWQKRNYAYQWQFECFFFSDESDEE